MENANIVEIANNTNKKRKLRKTHNKSEKAKTTEKPNRENLGKCKKEAKRQKLWETEIMKNYRIRENVKIVENTKSVRNTPKITILISNVGIWLRSEYCKWKSETFLSNFYTL